MKHEPVELAVIGGGAAGLMAAATAVGRRVGCVVIEGKARVGSKMLMTANGRCNFTKDVSVERMLADIGEPVASFVRPALTACPPEMIAGGFRARGLRIKRMTDGRLFPASEKAADVVHVFGDLLRDGEVPLLTNCRVTGVQPVKTGFIVGTPRFTLWARNVLIATGGASFPKTGSVGDGQAWARALGHRLEPMRAGLTGFEVKEDRGDPPGAIPRSSFRKAQGLPGEASVLVEGKEVCRYAGEVEFMPWGVSGAAVYNCQRWAARQGLRDFALRVATRDGSRTFARPVARPLKEAIVTMGGVARDEVDPRTMMSRRVPGLYFAGEVLDIDGPTGGYNLSLAFATARLAVASVCAAR